MAESVYSGRRGGKPAGAGKTGTSTSSSTGSKVTASNTSTNKTKSKTQTLTIGGKSYVVPSSSTRQQSTNSPTKVVSSATINTQSVSQAQPKKTTDAPLSGLFGTATVSTNAPYAQTQNRKFTTNSQSQIAKSIQPANKAQPESFTYAQDKSGNTYVINSQLSLQQRQDLKNQGIATSSIPFITTGFASVPTGLDPTGHVRYPKTIDYGTATQDEIAAFFAATNQPREIIVDENLANQNNLYYDLTETQGYTIIDPVDTIDDGFTPNQATEATEQSEEANRVQLEANILDDHQHITTEKADERYADGKTLTSQGDDPLSVELLAGQEVYTKEQWMSQFNQEIVPTPTYDAFAANGKNGKNGIMTNGNGKANGNGKVNGMANLGATFEKITGSKWFPIVIVGIIVLFVITLLKPKAAAAAPSAPSKVFQFA